MALAKERGTQDSHMALMQAFSLYGNVYGGGSSVQVPDSSSLGLFNHHETVIEEGKSSDFINGNGSVKNFSVVSRFPYLSTPSNGFVFGASNSPPEEALSVINFKAGYDHLGCPVESLLSFEQGERLSYNSYNHEDDHSNWADFMDKNDQWNQLNPECGTDSRLSEDLNCLEMARDYGMMNTAANIDENEEERMGWSYSGAADASRSVQQFGGQVACSHHKRPYMGDDDKQALKKRCAGTPRKPKPKSVPSKDPQSMAAKNRRERISERLKKLQDLVPNGAKVDLVTMLEKAISYVKFLQLQVKVLATDELWPSPSGKTPEVAQVKEVIDAILSSQRDRISNSK